MVVSGKCHAAFPQQLRRACWTLALALTILSASSQHITPQVGQLPAIPTWEQRGVRFVAYDPSQQQVVASSQFDTRSAFNEGEYSVGWDLDYGDLESVQVRADAAYPDPHSQHPNGWRFKALANSSLAFIYPLEYTSDEVKLSNTAIANSKLAPALAFAGTSGQHAGRLRGQTTALAAGRPGLQYGAVVAAADQQLKNTNIEFGDLAMATRARATSGQGVAVALARSRGTVDSGILTSETRADANAARWYMSPGHAIAGASNIAQGGFTYLKTENRARAELGSASGGVLNVARSISDFGLGARQRRRAVTLHSEIDQKVNADAGSAAAGYINLADGAGREDIQVVNFPGATAATAVGNAAAGGITVAYSEGGAAFIGDYDDEWDSPENDVAATTRGRGSAQAGQINIAVAPNWDAGALGDVKAIANQGSAVAGAFTLTNAYRSAYQGVDVNSRTSEHSAIAGNVGVSQAAEQAQLANTATAKTTTGSSMAYTVANAAVSKQSISTGAADATTTTGQSAGIALSQAVGGVLAEAQGASSATTSDGNALSISSAAAGSTMVSRSVATAASASREGQAVSVSVGVSVAADSTADVAASAATTTGNAAVSVQGYGIGALQGKAVVASSAGTEQGSAGSLTLGASTGLLQAQTKVASSAETKDGHAISLTGAASLAAINSVASATTSAASETGDVSSTALAAAIGGFHGEALARSSSGTGCVDCISDAVGAALATGLVADATAEAEADSEQNPGNALANAIAIGLLSRTSNRGSSRVAIGPGQALSGGFAVSAPQRSIDDAADAAVQASRLESAMRLGKEHASIAQEHVQQQMQAARHEQMNVGAEASTQQRMRRQQALAARMAGNGYISGKL